MSPLQIKLPYLQNVQSRNRRGQYYSYYRRDGLSFRVTGVAGSTEWLASYQEIHSRFEQSRPKPKKALPEDIFSEVVTAYRSTLRYTRLKAKTKANYEVEIRRLLDVFGDASIRQINARHISEFRDKVSALKSPRAAKETMKVIRLIFKAAVERAIIVQNPAAGVDDPINYKAEPWRHWEDDEISLFLAHAAPRWRRAVNVLLHTGLRLSDAIQVRRGDIKDGLLRWREEKTDTPVVIPIHSDLAAELELPMEVESVYLIASVTGKPFELASSINHGIVREFKRLGIDNPPPPHGLRKNAVMRLLQAGCETEDVRAVTGQSREMIDHYGKQYDRERRARAAILKLESIKDDR